MSDIPSPITSGASVPENSLPPPVADDHRRFARRACKIQARLTVSEAWDPDFGEVRQFEVVVRNISRNGVAFVFFRQMYPDDLVALNFGDLQRQYRVARCRRLAANCYEVGAAVVAS
jgi:hypothetical protein